MDLSDDIAYGVHDLEDAIALGLVDEGDFRECVSEAGSAPFLDLLKTRYPEECGNDVYDYFVSRLFAESNWRKRFIGRLVQHLEFKGQKLVVSVFEAIQSDPKSLLPADAYARFPIREDVRAICDYVAGMTDNFLLKTYDRLFSPRMGSVFDKL
ncbi:dGTP triphosphohydrolase [Bradyrhizobium yuanmingense]|uniref:hypothetical protein n=1 Tax=Bradyrhizobium yuanmingense TaxID=108015 RepID=UPI0035198B7E